MVVNWKNGNDVTIFRHDVIVKYVWRCLDSLVNFSYLPKFHVNIIIGSGVMSISFYKGLTRNPEIGNNPVRVLPNIWKLGQVKKKILAQTSRIRFYWILQNARVAPFTISELLRENNKGVKLPSPTQIRVKVIYFNVSLRFLKKSRKCVMRTSLLDRCCYLSNPVLSRDTNDWQKSEHLLMWISNFFIGKGMQEVFSYIAYR